MQVQALEEYLRVPLFRRNGRQVELTPQGALLRPKVEEALADLERAIDEARADRGSGPLRVTTIASFLAQWLLPRLPNLDRKSTRLNSSHEWNSYAVFCLKKKKEHVEHPVDG